MGGLMSRRKGTRVEYEVRDYFRNLGYTADRVPFSGSAQGFKGDVKVIADGTPFLVEVKARKEEFKKIYVVYANLKSPNDRMGIVHNGVCIDVSTDFTQVVHNNRFYEQLTSALELEHKRGLHQLVKLKEVVKECQYLVLKDNNKPLLFVRYS